MRRSDLEVKPFMPPEVDSSHKFSTTDGGKTWKTDSIATMMNFPEDVYLSSPSSGYIIGDGGKIIRLSK